MSRSVTFDILYVCGKSLAEEKLENLANHELFAKTFHSDIHRYPKNVFDICADFNLFTYQWLLPVWFAKKFPLTKFFHV